MEIDNSILINSNSIVQNWVSIFISVMLNRPTWAVARLIINVSGSHTIRHRHGLLYTGVTCYIQVLHVSITDVN